MVPGLPSTVFFILAAWAFSKSSPRLEAWVLGLPRIGPLVEDYREGRGMSRRAKLTATATIAIFVGISLFTLDQWEIRLVVAGVTAVGLGYIWLRLPTKRPDAT